MCMQCQGAGSSGARAGATRRGYAVGTAVLGAVLRPSAGPTDVVPGEARPVTLKLYLFGKMAGVILHVPRTPGPAVVQ
jgi:hypothetical protein